MPPTGLHPVAAKGVNIVLDNLERKASDVNLDLAYPTTFFSDLEATTKTERELTFAQLSAELSRPSASTKFELPLFRLSRFDDTPNETGCLRYNENVIAYTGAMGDYDAEKIPIDIAYKKCEQAGVKAILYTTARHTPETP